MPSAATRCAIFRCGMPMACSKVPFRDGVKRSRTGCASVGRRAIPKWSTLMRSGRRSTTAIWSCCVMAITLSPTRRWVRIRNVLMASTACVSRSGHRTHAGSAPSERSIPGMAAGTRCVCATAPESGKSSFRMPPSVICTNSKSSAPTAACCRPKPIRMRAPPNCARAPPAGSWTCRRQQHCRRNALPRTNAMHRSACMKCMPDPGAKARTADSPIGMNLPIHCRRMRHRWASPMCS